MGKVHCPFLKRIKWETVQLFDDALSLCQKSVWKVTIKEDLCRREETDERETGGELVAKDIVVLVDFFVSDDGEGEMELTEDGAEDGESAE